MASCCFRRISSNTVDEPRTNNTNPSPSIVVTKENCVAAIICVIFAPILFILALKFVIWFYGPSPDPTFILESVSVVLDDFPNDTSQMNVDWNIGFYVEYVTPSADFKVSVNCMLRNSTTLVFSGSRYVWKETSDDSYKTRMNATVHSLLPKFNTTNAGLEFDVKLSASRDKGYYNNMCAGVKLKFLPGRDIGPMLKGKMECYPVDYW